MNTGGKGAVCFGKIPSRGDFIKGGGQHQLIQVLDKWVTQAMEQLSEDPRWKTAYDNAVGIDFVFAGARSRISVVGHIRPSSDASGRRFPFITAGTIERDDALVFRCAPVALVQIFGELAGVCEAGLQGAEVASLLTTLEGIDAAGEFARSLQSDPLGNFVRRTTLEILAAMLGCSDCSPVRRTILAIGLLMRPLLGQGNAVVDKELVFALPRDERSRNLVAGLWIYLVTAFLRKSGVEAQFLIQRAPQAPRLVIGFNGSSAAALTAAITPESGSERVISLVDPEWVDQQLAANREYGLAKLSAYLEQPAITLELAIQTFREVYLGE
ncbi:type VI secretion system-associated protein TagF [Azonexus sp.]|uniref:type VI secretion system-associated protein TagF n=1 Tax=Azonexus sp. TaxID=1872668 RepID=UPI0035B4E4CB